MGTAPYGSWVSGCGRTGCAGLPGRPLGRNRRLTGQAGPGGSGGERGGADGELEAVALPAPMARIGTASSRRPEAKRPTTAPMVFLIAAVRWGGQLGRATGLGQGVGVSGHAASGGRTSSDRTRSHRPRQVRHQQQRARPAELPRREPRPALAPELADRPAHRGVPGSHRALRRHGVLRLAPRSRPRPTPCRWRAGPGAARSPGSSPPAGPTESPTAALRRVCGGSTTQVIRFLVTSGARPGGQLVAGRLWTT